MAAGQRKPLAFVSTSLREEDQPFVKLVERLIRENGFEPMGTHIQHLSQSGIVFWRIYLRLTVSSWRPKF